MTNLDIVKYYKFQEFFEVPESNNSDFSLNNLYRKKINDDTYMVLGFYTDKSIISEHYTIGNLDITKNKFYKFYNKNDLIKHLNIYFKYELRISKMKSLI